MNIGKSIRLSLLALLLNLGLFITIPVSAEYMERSFCVFDVVGSNGPVYNHMKTYRTKALNWGVKVNLLPYTDETVAVEDFQSGHCDGVVLTGVRNRQLVRFAGSTDMMGAIPSYKHLRKAIEVLSLPKSEKYMQTEKYETVGIFPAGAVYLYVRPEIIRQQEGTPGVEDLAGKRIAALRYDKQQLAMIRHVGASPIATDITNFAGMFNDGNVDLLPATAGAYQVLELYKGLGEDGKIVDFELAHLTYQITIRHKKFPDDFGQESRNLAIEIFDKAEELLLEARKKVPEKYWMDVPEDKMPKYQSLFREVRQKLKKRGIYSSQMMKLLRRIRCKYNSTRAECSM